mmetsp:Transcript_112831/g.319085  ORF Transcript_112831/g.319085 Transcript_112831/m.319085 type:complete len:265 (-) Transcript_112831:650-1444(-)
MPTPPAVAADRTFAAGLARHSAGAGYDNVQRSVGRPRKVGTRPRFLRGYAGRGHGVGLDHAQHCKQRTWQWTTVEVVLGGVPGGPGQAAGAKRDFPRRRAQRARKGWSLGSRAHFAPGVAGHWPGADCRRFRRGHKCSREGRTLGVGFGIAGGHALVGRGTQHDHFQCRHQRAREGRPVGTRAVFATGHAAGEPDVGRRRAQRDHQRAGERHSVGTVGTRLGRDEDSVPGAQRDHVQRRAELARKERSMAACLRLRWHDAGEGH